MSRTGLATGGILLLLSAISWGAAKIVSFPSTQTEARSPNGQFAVINVDSDAEPHHALYLQDRQNKTKRKLMDYRRWVEVLWNPNGTAFAVTDYAGSNVAECLVFSAAGDAPPRNVGDALRNSIKNPRELAELRESIHIYWTAVRWKSPRTLIVKVWGHTDVNPSHGFQYSHAYELVR